LPSNRRDFLRYSLCVLGVAAGGETVQRLRASPLDPSSQPQGGGTPAPTPLPTPAPTPALTPDHQLVHVHGDGSMTAMHAAPAASVSNAAARAGIPGRKWVMVIDLAKCDGCGACMSACGKMHFIPPDRQWIKVLRMQDAEETAPYFFPQPCYHCDNPPCTKVCPVDATFKRQDGIVLIDNDRCIGCRFCMAACPYGARSFNWGKPADPPDAAAQPYSPEHGFPRRIGTVEKCDFCPDMAAQGILPACTAGCPMGAIYYGDELEDAVTNSQGETPRLSQMLLDRSGYRHLEELGTKPRVYYLPPRNRAFPAPGHEKARS